MVKEALIEEIPSEEEDKEIGVPLYKIVSYPSDPTLEVLNEKRRRKEIEIPEFQRGWVWKPVQASRLIDSFLLGLPVPAIFVYKEPGQKQVVIDGQQRLRTIWGFFQGKLPEGGDFYLRGVSPQWEGKSYETLTEADRIRFRDSVLRVMIVEQLDPKDNTSIYHIFERLNTGGTSLTPQEVRNCMYHGPFNDLMRELNRDPTWRRIFGSKDVDARMRDLELIVRFLALLEGADSYTKPMKQFLNNYMATHQTDGAREPYQSTFVSTIKRVYDSLGGRPFHIRRGINVAVFDSVMLAFARSNTIPGDRTDRFNELLRNPSYVEAVSSGTTDVDAVRRRIELAKEILLK
ncbi:MAG: DUF262 domain-containing protein [Dehalococcoidia bacterium]|nr:DUF262 domain-containing protein [Dehalococcoidia bacterium]